MTGGRSTPIVLDTTVLSNFASSDSIDWLSDLLAHAYTVPAVRTELSRGIDAGHTYLESAHRAIERNQFEIVSPADAVVEQHGHVRERLDPGEFEAVVVARDRDWTLATDDAAGRQVATEARVDVTGSIGLLVRGIARSDLSISRANEWLTSWTDTRGYYAPVDRIEEAPRTTTPLPDVFCC